MGNNSFQIWVKPLVGDNQAIALTDFNDDGTPAVQSFSLKDLGFEKPAGRYLLQDIFDGGLSQMYAIDDVIHVAVNPHGIRMFRAIPDYQAVRVFEVDVAEFEIL